MHNFTNAAILVAERLYDYYQTRELVIYDYVGENYDPVEYHIKNFIVTGKDLPPLLIELENVQDPEHWKYQGWASEKILQQWLAHIQSVQQTLDLVCENFSTVIVLYNGSNPLELGFVEEYDQIKATLWCAGPGNTGFAALDRILNGAVNPSGRTTDTFVYDMTQTSWWNNSSKVSYTNMDHMAQEGTNAGRPTTYYPSFLNYAEGICVGYKFYETAAAEGLIDYDKLVQFPFGHGLSYTTFTQIITL